VASKDILLLTADNTYASSVRKYLERECDAQVFVESDMSRAIDMINWTEFDAVICDHTPELDGVALVSSMRDNHFTTPFILVHEAGMGDAMTVKGLVAGADHTLPKGSGSEQRALLVMLETRWAELDRLHVATDLAEMQRRILNKGPDLIMVIDAQVRIRYINEHALDFFSLELDAILGRSPIGRLFPPVGPDGKDILVKLSGWMDRPTANGVLPVLVQGKTANLRVGTASWDDNGIKGMALFLRSPDSPCQIGEGHCILHKIREAIATVDFEGRFTFINAEAERLLGFNRLDIIGKNAKDVFPQIVGTPIQTEFLRSSRSRQPINIEVWFDAVPSMAGWFDLRFYPHSEGINIIFFPITKRKETEEKLRASEDRFRTMAEQAFEGIFLLDENGKVEYVNQQMADILGIPIEAVQDSDLSSVVSPDQLKEVLDIFDRMKTVDAESFPFQLRRFDGQKRHILVNLATRRYVDGGFHGYIGMISDTTEQAEKQARMRFQAMALKHINAGLAVVDKKGSIIFWNPRAEEMFGWKVEEVLGRSVLEFLTPSSDPKYQGPIRDAIHSKGTIEMELWQTRRDGSKFLSFMQLARVDDEKGDLIGTVTLINDVTIYKELEERLKQANKKLHLMADVTRHDIMNQITILSAGLELASESNDMATALPYLNKAKGNLRNIEDLMAFSRDYLRLGTTDPKWVPAESLFKESYRILDTKNIKFHCGVRDLELFVDPMMEKVFYNMVDNSIRHGEHVKEISLSYSGDEQGIVMVYEDDGVGVPKDKKQSILDERSARLGMRLVKEILRVNGIGIVENGAYQKGVRFEMYVPPGRFRIAPASI